MCVRNYKIGTLFRFNFYGKREDVSHFLLGCCLINLNEYRLSSTLAYVAKLACAASENHDIQVSLGSPNFLVDLLPG